MIFRAVSELLSFFLPSIGTGARAHAMSSPTSASRGESSTRAKRKQLPHEHEHADADESLRALPLNPQFAGDEMSAVDADVLQSELQCPICLRLMREPHATECLHRFCKDCIEKCLRKTCPTCRKPIATRRSLRPDPNMSSLIAKLYPDLEAFEAAEERQAHERSERLRREHVEHMRAAWDAQRQRLAEYEAEERRRQAEEQAARQARQEQRRLEQRQRAPLLNRPAWDSVHEVEVEVDVDEEAAEAHDEDEDGHAAQRQGQRQGHQHDGYDAGEEEAEVLAADEEASGLMDAQLLPPPPPPPYSAASPDAAADPGRSVARWPSSAATPAKGGRSGGRGDRGGGGGGREGRTITSGRGGGGGKKRAVLTPRDFELGFRLSRHPRETRLPQLLRDFVTVTCLATVSNVQGFLAHSFRLDSGCAPAFEVHVVLQDTFLASLSGDMSLHDVVQRFHLEASSLEFLYRYTGPLPLAPEE
jgi:hypothetical protein